MNRDRLFQTIHDDLKTFVEANKGEFSVAVDPYHILELLAESPRGWRGVLHFAGDDRLGDGAIALDGSFRDNVIEVAVSCNPGLSIDPDATLFEKRPGDTPPLLRLCDLVEDRVRSMRITSPDEDSGEYFNYRGMKPVTTPDGLPLRAYVLRFTIESAPTRIAEGAYRSVAAVTDD